MPPATSTRMSKSLSIRVSTSSVRSSLGIPGRTFDRSRTATPTSSASAVAASVSASRRDGSAKSWASEVPTKPPPITPTRTTPSFIEIRLTQGRLEADLEAREILEGLTAKHFTRGTVVDEHDRRTWDAVVVRGHRVHVGAGHRRGDETVHPSGRRQVRLVHQHVAALAVLTHQAYLLGARGEWLSDVEGFVARAVEHRPWVIAHAAVDGHVRALSHGFDDADAIDRDGGLGHNRTSRLGEDTHVRAKTAFSRGVTNGLSPLGDGRRGLTGDVGHAQPSPDAELVKVVVLREVHQHADRLPEAVDFKDLRANMRVHTVQSESLNRSQLLNRSTRFAGRHGESELGVFLSGPYVLVSVRFDARRDAHQGIHRRVARHRSP